MHNMNFQNQNRLPLCMSMKFENENKFALCIFELSRLKQTPLYTFVNSLDQNKRTLCVF
jgi:hypothetical protein